MSSGGYGTFQENENDKTEKEPQSKTAWFGAYTSPPSQKWGTEWATSVKGSEWVHLYVWIIKDLAWNQGWYFTGMFGGSAAVMGSAVLLYRAIRSRNTIEMWHYTAQFLWLFANFWWMWGELHDLQYPDEEKISSKQSSQGKFMLIIAMHWIVFYYLIVRPMQLLPPPPKESIDTYDASGVEPHNYLSLLFLFPTWRQYEHVHILVWLGKDMAWTMNWRELWVVFALLTLLVALDFVVTTSLYHGMLVDHVHYVAQMLWVLASISWAFGELYLGPPEADYPRPLLQVPGAWDVGLMRWGASWLLVTMLALLAALHAYWLAYWPASPESTPPRPPAPSQSVLC